MSDVPIDGTPDPAAVVAENQALQHKLEKYEGEKRVKRVKLRKILVGILVVLTCLSITVTTVDTWAHRTLLNTNEWVATVGPLGTDPQVTAALARPRSSLPRSRTRSRGSSTTRWSRSSVRPPGRRSGPRRTASRTNRW